MMKDELNEFEKILVETAKSTHCSKSYAILQTRGEVGAEYIKNINEILKILEENNVLNDINSRNKCFKEYTDHGYRHAATVLLNMESMVLNLETLSCLELTAIILSALLHDIGMFYEEDEFNEENLEKVPEWLLDRNSMVDFSEVKKQKGENFAIQYIVRTNHGKRAGYNMDKFSISEICQNVYIKSGYSDVIKFICESHQIDFDELKTRYHQSWSPYNTDYIDLSSDWGKEGRINVLFIAMLLRIADLMDFDCDRAPKDAYEYLQIKDPTSRYEWLKNGLITNRIKINGENDNLSKKCPNCGESYYKLISFYTKPLPNSRDLVETELYFSALKGVKKYIEYIETEIQSIIENFNAICRDKKYILFLYPKVNLESFEAPNAQIEFNYKTIVDMFLTETVYGEKRVGLRELIQNAMDACRYRLAYEGDTYNPIIKLIFDYDNNKFIIEDNGRGMTKDIVQKHFLSIGGSIYKSDAYRYSKYKFTHAGHFGIGFFAAFMLSRNDVSVETSFFNSNEKIIIRVSSQNDFYRIFNSAFENGERPGFTRIILNLDDVIDAFKFKVENDIVQGEDCIASFIENNFICGIEHDRYITFKKKVIRQGVINESSLNVKKIIDDNDFSCRLDEYFDDVQVQIAYNQSTIKKPMKWFSYNENTNSFSECNISDITKYYELYYLRIDVENEQLYLFVPNGNNETLNAFGYDVQNSQRLVSSGEETLYASGNGCNIKFKNFSPAKSILDHQDAFVCLRGKFSVFCFDGHITLVNPNQRFDDELPTTKAIKSGIVKSETVYLRNIRIPKASIKLPYMIVGIDNEVFQLPSSIIININQSGILPKTNRNEFNDDVIQGLSFAVGRAYMKYVLKNYFGKDVVVDNITERLYPTAKLLEQIAINGGKNISNDPNYIFIEKGETK